VAVFKPPWFHTVNKAKPVPQAKNAIFTLKMRFFVENYPKVFQNKKKI